MLYTYVRVGYCMICVFIIRMNFSQEIFEIVINIMNINILRKKFFKFKKLK